MKNGYSITKTNKNSKNLKQSSYSSFWMDKEDVNAGLLPNVGSASSDLVRLIKLNNYRRAVSNFVKIITNKEIPVQWAGPQSFTDGRSITLTTDIKQDNFDVVVGLALHEASHVLLSDFDLVKKLVSNLLPEINAFKETFPYCTTANIKDLLNWIEDRRIDNFIFKTSPGYKAYYHKLYDYYWGADVQSISNGLQSSAFREPTFDNYMFHIINMISPAFNPHAMPGLLKITELINLRNIGRLKSTQDSLQVTLEVLMVVSANLKQASTKPSQSADTQPQSVQGISSSAKQDSQPHAKADSPKADGPKADSDKTNSPKADSDKADDKTDDTESTASEQEAEKPITLTSKEVDAIKAAIQKQKAFINHNSFLDSKKLASHRLEKELSRVEQSDYDVTQIKVGAKSISMLYNDLTTKTGELAELAAYCEYRALDNAIKKTVPEVKYPSTDTNSVSAVLEHCMSRKSVLSAMQRGLDQGAILGKKLTIHNETRDRVDTRLTTGRIDGRRLAHAGYGMDSLFKQITTNKHKKAVVHLSLDGSGSMEGAKWCATVQLAVAIAKAISYAQNIELEISVRDTTRSLAGAVPRTLLVYKSKKNSLHHLMQFFKVYDPTSYTPEGLCYEALIKKNMFTAGTNELDSYFINICDGMPCGVRSYEDSLATNHTAEQVRRMKDILGMKILSFFVSDKPYHEINHNSREARNHREMYGRNARTINTDSMVAVASELNNMFLSK